jgi:hypothetical protein
MTKVLLLLSFLVCGCAQGRITPKYTESSSEVASYVYEFQRVIIPDNARAQKRLKYTKLRIVDSWDTSYIGFCNPVLLDGTAEIDLDRQYFEKSSEIERQFTVFHELAHCVCFAHHTSPTNGDGFGDRLEALMFKLGLYEETARLPDSCPKSLMHPYALSQYCMTQHIDYYMAELKNQCNGN